MKDQQVWINKDLADEIEKSHALAIGERIYLDKLRDFLEDALKLGLKALNRQLREPARKDEGG